MNQNRVAVVTQSLTSLPSRRDVLRGLAGAGLGLGAARLPTMAAAKKKRKKNKKPKPNQYGCLEVGDPCKTAGQCCSGICEGTKDKRTCRAHGTGTCNQKAPGVCEAGDVSDTLCNGQQCLCTRTTAGSKFCGSHAFPSACASCQRDADCVALGFPPGTACAPFTGEFACAGTCEETGGMACLVPCGYVPPDPA
ncbi:MAG: hypothetical protein ACRDJC_23030 [Thermomicrobiales bacterium]